MQEWWIIHDCMSGEEVNRVLAYTRRQALEGYSSDHTAYRASTAEYLQDRWEREQVE